jgi:predicted RNase H-like nuclease
VTGAIHARVWPTFAALLAWASEPAIIAVDIPIGLRSACGERSCDVAARALLKWPRSASVFPTPVRQTLEANSYAQANSRHREITAKGLSKQAFNILEKIAEVDRALRAERRDAERVFEVHPELAFMQLQVEQGGPCGGISVAKRKPDGHHIRLALLAAAFGTELDAALAALAERAAGVARRDDVVDAFAALWSARRIAQGKALALPRMPERDAVGLPMVIHY